MAAGVPHPRDEQVFVPVGRHAARAIWRQFHPPLRGADARKSLWLGEVLDLKRHLRVVAADDDEFCPVGREHDGMRTVFTAAAECAELLDRVERVVLVRVSDAVEPAAGAAVADDIETVEGPEEALRAGERHRDFFDHRRPRAVERRGRDPHQALITLIAGDEPALWIGGDADPRAELVLRHDEEPLDLEAVRHGKRCDSRLRCRRRGGRLRSRGARHRHLFKRSFPSRLGSCRLRLGRHGCRSGGEPGEHRGDHQTGGTSWKRGGGVSLAHGRSSRVSVEWESLPQHRRPVDNTFIHDSRASGAAQQRRMQAEPSRRDHGAAVGSIGICASEYFIKPGTNGLL